MFVVDRKRDDAKLKIILICGCQKGCGKCVGKRNFIDRMADANIPCVYWDLPYANFSGAQTIKKITKDYAKNIEQRYKDGACICYAGTLGTGKTFSACSILKVALMKGYGVYYTTLTDMSFYLTDFEYRDKFYHRATRTDILCIDEVDARHRADSETSGDFFGRTFERIIRYRIQNKLPIIIATNNAKIEEAFSGQFKKVIESLAAANTIIVPALGPDYRLKVGRSK